MKQLFLFLILFLTSVLSFAQVHVRGYYRKNGTYVRPHVRTRPNHTKTDNYSYPGNYNPNTGRTTGGSVRVGDTSNPATTHYDNYDTTPNTYVEDRSTLETEQEPIAAPINSITASSQLYAEVEPNAALKVEASYQAHSMYAIPRGTLVKVARYNEYYYTAEVNGRSGYVCTCQVKKTFEVSKDGIRLR